MTQTERRATTALGLAAVALFAAAVNLRPAIAAVSPLVGRIQEDLSLSATGASLLTTIPTLAMGLVAPLAAVVGRRCGLHRGVLLGLLLIALATAARVIGTATWLQLSSAALVGAGIAVAQTLLPAVVKTRFADRAGLVTGIYTAGLGLGGALAAGVSAPLAGLLDSWPAALASWALLALAGAALWTAAKDQLALDIVTTVGPLTSGLPWRDVTAWRIAAISAVNSALYYCELAWVAPLLHDSGRSTTAAGLMVTILISLQVLAMLVVPIVAGENRDPRRAVAVTLVLTAAGFLGLGLAPSGAVAWLWIVAVGVGHGGLFTLVLTLPVLLSRNPAEAGRLSALTFFVGYACAAIAPTAVGILRDSLGSFDLAFTLLGILGLLTLRPVSRLAASGQPADQR